MLRAISSSLISDPSPQNRPQSVVSRPCHNGRQEVKEVKYDSCASARLDAKGNKCVKSMAGMVRICGVVRKVQEIFLRDARTGFANAEELIDVPCYDTAREATPTPLEDTAQGLSDVSATDLTCLSLRVRTNGSVRRNSVASPSPVYWRLPSYAALKKLRMKLRDALVSDVGRKGSRTKGMSSAVKS